jgi:hypothetical protein
LVLGLVAVGGRPGEGFAGVILFRLISAWGIVPLGWGIWALTKGRESQRSPAVDRPGS